jgi:hypothetical protein
MMERLRMENDFMKMKLMLEHGARFHSAKDGAGLDPAVEYAFLKQVLAFEEEFASGRRKTVFEKLGRPSDIRPVQALADGELGEALSEMHRRLNDQGIHISTLSPDVAPRELYRFMTEELMQVELCSADTPGMHCFVYDEFHPDPRHQNERTAVDLCIRLVLQKRNLMHMFPAGRPLRLNEHEKLGETEFRQKVHAFKSRYEDIVPVRIEATRTELRDDICRITGTHVTGLCLEGRCDRVKGDWQVGFRLDSQGEWLVTDVRIGGIDI